MKALYILYQIFIALPILLVLTILTALVTIVGSWIGDPHVWGYYPGKIWSQLFCYVLLIPVKVVGHPEVLTKLHMSLLPTIRAHSIYSSFTAFWAAISNG